MGKNDFMTGRNEGMAYALKIVEVDGVEGLRHEIKSRNITGISLNTSHKELEEACGTMRQRMFDTVLCMCLAVLHDYYGWGRIRCRRFMNYFKEGADMLQDNVVYWEDIQRNIDTILKEKIRITDNDRQTLIKRRY